jgi:cytochrome c oxidase cbb3-type subunit 3
MKNDDGSPTTETTGHEWDGIRELNTPLPRWWLWTFYATVIWGLGYTIAYPAWPLVSSATSGLLGYSSRAQLQVEQDAARRAQEEVRQLISSSSLSEIRTNPELLAFANAGGAAAFRVNCVQCHGSGAQGGTGYPNLNDDDWIWGGDLEAIYTTVSHGARFAPDTDTRISDMPNFGTDQILTAEQITDTAEFVLKLSGQEHDPQKANRGQVVFGENCSACHGPGGEGVRELGGPRLNDAIWLLGNSREAIVGQIRHPRTGVMPAWAHRLDDSTLKQLTIFVHSLGGGEAGAGEK